MGVNGLQSFLERDLNIFSKTINLTSIAKGMKEPLILGVDGSGLLYWMYASHSLFLPPLKWWLNGDYLALADKIALFIDSLRSNNIELHVFLDGMTEDASTPQSKTFQRRKSEVEVAVETRTSIIHQEQGKSQFVASSKVILPLFVKETLLSVLRDRNVKFFQSEFEADRALAAYCIEKHCFGVLARDTDFLIYDLPCYIPLQNLDINNPVSNGKAPEIIAKQFSATHLATSFRFDKRFLPLFAVILGNDDTNKHEKYLQLIYEKLCEKKFNHSRVGNRDAIIRLVSGFLARQTYNAQDVCSCVNQLLHGCATRTKIVSMLKSALSRYSLPSFSITNKNLLPKLNSLRPEAVKLFEQSLFDISLVSIVERHQFWFRVILEDYNNVSNSITAPIRTKLYGLLLKQQTIGLEISEYRFDGRQFQRKTQNSASIVEQPEQKENEQCLCQILSIQPNFLEICRAYLSSNQITTNETMSKHFQWTMIALNTLIRLNGIHQQLEEWEFSALVCCLAVTRSRFDSIMQQKNQFEKQEIAKKNESQLFSVLGQHQRKEPQPTSTTTTTNPKNSNPTLSFRAIWISSVFQQTLYHVLLANAVSNFPMGQTMPPIWTIIDGFLWQRIYRSFQKHFEKGQSFVNDFSQFSDSKDEPLLKVEIYKLLYDGLDSQSIWKQLEKNISNKDKEREKEANVNNKDGNVNNVENNVLASSESTKPTHVLGLEVQSNVFDCLDES